MNEEYIYVKTNKGVKRLKFSRETKTLKIGIDSQGVETKFNKSTGIKHVQSQYMMRRDEIITHKEYIEESTTILKNKILEAETEIQYLEQKIKHIKMNLQEIENE